MTTLQIDRLSATAHVREAQPGVRDALERMLATMARRTLGEAVESAGLPSGDWYLDRVDVQVRLDALRDDAGGGRLWADQIVAAVRAALAAGTALHFATHIDALADLVAECAVGRYEHAWAWRQAGLVSGDVAAAPLAAVLAAVAAHPQLALPAMARAAQVSGVAAVHRLLGSSGWVGLARVVLAAHAAHADPSPAPLDAAPEAVAANGAHPAASARAGGLAAAKARTVVQTSAVAQLLTRSRLRPDRETALAWAVLCVADAEPALLPRAVAASVITEVAERLAPAAQVPAAVPGGAAEHEVAEHGMAEHGAADHDVADRGDPPQADEPQRHLQREAEPPPQVRTAAASDDQRVDEASALASEESGAPTAWGGLLFLLATAADADIPDALLTDDALASRPLAWVLHAIALDVVPADPDDPAALAFAGLCPGDEPPSLTWRPATDVERERVSAHARRWAEVTAHRVDPTERDVTALVRSIARRRGRVIAERAWVDVELRLDEVDVPVRRAGLDVDPGWVPWLGSVVRFRYV